MISLKEGSNLKSAFVIDRIKNTIESNKAYYGDICIHCAAVRDYNNRERWVNALCLIKAFPKNQEPPKQETLLYKNVHLLEMWLSLETFIPFIEQTNDENQDTIIDNEKVFGISTQYWQCEPIPGMNDYSIYPGDLYTASSRNNLSELYNPLLTFKLPFYKQGYDAIQQWLKFNEFHNGSDGRIGSTLLFLPECRARFEEIKYQEENIVIKVKKSDSSIGNLRIKGCWGRGGKTVAFEDSANNIVSLKVPEFAEDLEIYLIGEDETLYDYRKESRFWTMGHPRVIQHTTKKEESDIIKESLNTGECNRVEFKPYIKIGTPKINEIIESVISFANTAGGVIIIGVNKHCIVEGIEKELPGMNQPEQAIKEYVGEIRKFIGDKIIRVPQIEIKDSAYDGHRVVVIKVTEGNEKPYFNYHTKDIFIRRGSNNVKPDPDTELPNLLKNKTYLRNVGIANNDWL